MHLTDLGHVYAAYKASWQERVGPVLAPSCTLCQDI